MYKHDVVVAEEAVNMEKGKPKKINLKIDEKNIFDGVLRVTVSTIE